MQRTMIGTRGPDGTTRLVLSLPVTGSIRSPLGRARLRGGMGCGTGASTGRGRPARPSPFSRGWAWTSNRRNAGCIGSVLTGYAIVRASRIAITADGSKPGWPTSRRKTWFCSARAGQGRGGKRERAAPWSMAPPIACDGAQSAIVDRRPLGVNRTASTASGPRQRSSQPGEPDWR